MISDVQSARIFDFYVHTTPAAAGLEEFVNLEPWSRIEELRAHAGDGPVVMLNLLKFKPDGLEQYIRYSNAAMPIVNRHGGRLLYSGIVGERAHEDDAPEWDYVVLVEYPDLQAFVDIVTDPEYQAAHADRTGSVERALLRMTHPLDE